MPCSAGLYFGVLLFIDIWLLLIPVPQSSYLHELTGLDYHQMIRWHRWVEGQHPASPFPQG